MQAKARSAHLKEVALLFLKLGLIGFGGPAVHIALMEEEVVRKRKWITHQHFLDLVGATNLIPGPNSTELTMHLGKERAGTLGLFVAGSCFILPAVLITALFGFLYARYGQLPEVRPYVYGIQPAVIAVVLNAAYVLSRKAVKNGTLLTLGLITLAAVLFGVHEIAALFAAGAAGILLWLGRSRALSFLLPLLQLVLPPVPSPPSGRIFLIFLKVGALLYGSGYVLLPFLDAELVSRGLLERQELVDAIAVGQFTPGPVLSTATFVGWQLSGWPGALAATTGIFLPSFIFVLLLNPLIPKMRNSPLFGAFLDAVNVASVAVIVSVCYTMIRSSVTDWHTTLILLLSLLVSFGFPRVNSAFLIAGGALLGYLLSLPGAG